MIYICVILKVSLKAVCSASCARLSFFCSCVCRVGFSEAPAAQHTHQPLHGRRLAVPEDRHCDADYSKRGVEKAEREPTLA